jgi:Uma2 family endonuclease
MTRPIEHLSRNRVRFTVNQVKRMLETGVLTGKPRFELLDGELFEIGPTLPAHVWRVTDLTQRLVKQFDDRATLLRHPPIESPPDGLPQPDFALARREVPRDRWADASEIHLVIEVADLNLEELSRKKLKFYARGRVLECWIVNLVDDQLEVHRDPSGERYNTMFTVKTDTQTCLAFPDDPIRWR